MEVILKSKKASEKVRQKAKQAGLSPLQAHLIACRVHHLNIDFQKILRPTGKDIPHPNLLKGMSKGAKRIADAIVNGEAIVTFGDFDCDGLTGNAIFSTTLLQHFKVNPLQYRPMEGNRLTDGYGLTQKICDEILSMPIKPDLVITTDCGSSDEQRIAQLKKAGIDVIVTDHHEIPKEGVPNSAFVTINPMQKGCEYPDKSIAGCMVAWLTMCAVKINLVERGYIESSHSLTGLLDYVALGTIADAVSLFSPVNRYVINIGLRLMGNQSRCCWKAAAHQICKENAIFTVQDIAFQLAPRINARSRVNDPYAALHFLLAETDITAREYFEIISNDNATRKDIEKKMKTDALVQAEELRKSFRHSIAVYGDSFHPGVQGIVASRLTDKFGVPTIVFSPTEDPDVLTGSARTIESVPIRDVIQNIADQKSDIVLQFGGHKGAAGLKIPKNKIEEFRNLFDAEVKKIVGQETILVPVVEIDTSLADKGLIHMHSFKEIQKLQPFGNGFEEPIFADTFIVQDMKFIGETKVHASLNLKDTKGQTHKGVWFWALDNPDDEVPLKSGDFVQCAYKLNKNVFRGRENLQLMVQSLSR